MNDSLYSESMHFLLVTIAFLLLLGLCFETAMPSRITTFQFS